MKPNSLKTCIVAATLSLLSTNAIALPVKYADCQSGIKINEVPGSTATYFNADCSVVYVAPPRLGKMTISGLNPTGNPSLVCSQLKSVEETQANLLSVSTIQSKRMKKKAEEIAKIEENLNEGLLPLGKTRDDLEEEIITLMDDMDKLSTRQAKWSEEYIKERTRFTAEGSRGKFLIENTYSELIQAYREANPSLTFERLPLDQSYVAMIEQTASKDGDFRTNMSGLMSLLLPKTGKMPVLKGASAILNPKANAVEPVKTPSEAEGIFGDALSGEIALTQLGYCPLWSKNVNEFKMEDVENFIAANATYEYQVQVTRKHSITYNIQELVKQIHEQVKKNGFLSNKTMNTFIDERSSNSWITFHVESQDQRYEYSDEYIAEVKKEFLDRALKQVIAIQTGNPTAHLALIEPNGTNGADAIGNVLQKCPHLYCQIGAGGFKVLSALFGSSSATSTYIKSLQGSASEVVNEKKMVSQVGTLTFN